MEESLKRVKQDLAIITQERNELQIVVQRER